MGIGAQDFRLAFRRLKNSPRFFGFDPGTLLFVFKNLVALFFTKTKNCVSDATILILESAVSPLGPSGYGYCVNSTAAFQWAILKV